MPRSIGPRSCAWPSWSGKRPRHRARISASLEALAPARQQTGSLRFRHARARLLCDQGPEGPGWTMARTTTALGVSERTIARVKRRFVEKGLQATLRRKPRETPPRPVQFDAAFAARLMALACTEPPAGRALDLAAVGGAGRGPGAGPRHFRHERAPHSEKNALQPHRQRGGRIPPTENAAFVARREDVRGGVRPALRRRAPGGVQGRDPQATDGESDGAAASAGPTRPGGTRIRAPRHRRGLPGGGAAHGAGPWGGPAAAAGGVGPLDPGPAGDPVSGRRTGDAGDGPPAHARPRRALRPLPAGRGPGGTRGSRRSRTPADPGSVPETPATGSAASASPPARTRAPSGAPGGTPLSCSWCATPAHTARWRRCADPNAVVGPGSRSGPGRAAHTAAAGLP